MSKRIVGVLSIFILSLGISGGECALARESKGEKLEHAKNLQHLLYLVDSKILTPNVVLSKEDNTLILQGFNKVSVKMINKREVERVKKEIANFSSYADLRGFRTYLEKMFYVRLSPSITPSKKRGEDIYLKQCASCHGDGGKGDGVFAKRLEPKPSNLITEHFKKHVSAHMVFNYAVYGLPSGVMKPLGEVLDYFDLWSLSYYVIGLGFNSPSKGFEPNLDYSLKDLAAMDLVQFAKENPKLSLEDAAYLRLVLPYNRNNKRR